MDAFFLLGEVVYLPLDEEAPALPGGLPPCYERSVSPVVHAGDEVTALHPVHQRVIELNLSRLAA
eukprot:1590721-Pyramimonas_sp.AAC.1